MVRRRIASVLALLAAISIAGACSATQRERVVKWYPGHYLYFNWDASDGEMRKALADNPRLRGVMLQFTWRELEPERDRYDFARLRDLLDRAERLGTRVALAIEAQAYLPDANRIPDYIAGPEFGGGRYRLANGAVNPVLWNANVAERMGRLYRAVGAAFDAHPRLVAVTTTESALALARKAPPPEVEAYTTAKHEAAVIASMRALRAAFERTVVIQSLNYPHEILPGVVRVLRTLGVGLGGPDVFLDDPGLALGVYREYPKLAGVVPLAPAVQWDDYVMTRFEGTASNHGIGDLYRFARERLAANFVFWETRYVTRDFVDAIAKTMRAYDFPRSAAGGLADACPSVFTRCMSEAP